MYQCPICGSSAERTVPYPGAGRPLLRFGEIALCDGCGCGFALPRPEQLTLDGFYASGAYWHASSGASQRAHEASQGWLRVNTTKDLVLGPWAVADVGAGHGSIPRALSALGMRVSRYVFIEPDERAAADIAALRLPFPVERAFSLTQLRGPFDVVFLNHVVEHVADPAGFLRQVIQLAPNATVYVETPHADHRFKQDVFPHVFFFTPKALGILGERLGVHTVACETFGRMPAPRLSPLGMLQRVAARALPRVRNDTLQRLLDRIVWRYAPDPNGIWLRWIFSGMKAR